MKLSAYRTMWILVMFDLPTNSAANRKDAAKFRLFLKDNGFQMSQFSVYIKYIGARENSAKIVRLIKAATPAGKVSILFFTDKQFADIICIHHHKVTKMPVKPQQLLLF